MRLDRPDAVGLHAARAVAEFWLACGSEAADTRLHEVGCEIDEERRSIDAEVWERQLCVRLAGDGHERRRCMAG